MKCCKCGREFEADVTNRKKFRYCEYCMKEASLNITARKNLLISYQALPLEAKIIKSKLLIDEAIREFGKDKVYISYSGGKDSTVLSHLVRQGYPDILHLFSNTTVEYPETLKHILWEEEENNMNIIKVRPIDGNGKPFNFKRVVDEYGYPMFSKNVANAIRTYRRALTPRTKQNSIEYINRNFKKYEPYKTCNISDLCCDKLKKNPLKKKAKELGLECAVIGTLAEESRQRAGDWIKYGCNVFYEKKDNQCRPLSFWTEADIYEYIEKYNVRIPDLYKMGYNRNGCMFCGFGVQHEQSPNRFERLKETHPRSYAYLVDNFREILDEVGIKY
ncbi:MAG: phosphoadenosine phosphosulfate reductase family protein [Clostridium sp.]|nr:phosphoadenosine phosphosulfate reductase family protein [Clostridium sp.]